MPNDDETGTDRAHDETPNRFGALRRSYETGALEREALDPDPIRQVEAWLADAAEAGLREPNAMTLATADARGRVSARMVLLKGVDDGGFVFYTNYGSRKARDLHANPHAALVFWWPPLERQVRIEGRVERVDRDTSARYFATRPRDSQLGAWASRQSEAIDGRDVLERRLATLRDRWRDEAVPLPPFWGGFRLDPIRIEVWQGRENRLHDRFVYERREPTAADADAPAWHVARLSP